MELDHILLEKICMQKYNVDADQPVLLNLRDWHVVVDDTSWHAICSFTVGSQTGTGRWFGQDTLAVYKDEYVREMTATRREEKLKKIGIE